MPGPLEWGSTVHDKAFLCHMNVWALYKCKHQKAIKRMFDSGSVQMYLYMQKQVYKCMHTRAIVQRHARAIVQMHAQVSVQMHSPLFWAVTPLKTKAEALDIMNMKTVQTWWVGKGGIKAQ